MTETVRRPEEALNQKLEPRISQEEGDLRKASASPSRHQRHSAMSPGDTPKKTSRSSDRSADHSPLHPYYQAKPGAKGNGLSSSSLERKASSDSSHGLAPLTPVRSRMRSTPRGCETPDKGASVPKFGEWDESDPSSADGYTHIFNKVREEKQAGAGSTPSNAADNALSNGQFRNQNSKVCCCFPWTGN